MAPLPIRLMLLQSSVIFVLSSRTLFPHPVKTPRKRSLQFLASG